MMTASRGPVSRRVAHASLTGSDLVFLQARLAESRGDRDEARRPASECRDDMPGHRDYLAFALKTDAPIPSRVKNGLMNDLRSDST